MRRIAILGSTGSIGRQALDVITRHPGRFEIVGLAAGSRVDELVAQVSRFRPRVVSVGDAEKRDAIAPRLEAIAPGIRLTAGADGLRAVAVESGADVVLAATDGMVACDAVFEAVRRGITVALSNKEIAVAAGEPLFALAKASGTRVLPVDSEHSAVLQCLAGERASEVRSVVLTANGGPCWTFAPHELATVTPEIALRHPAWAMGPKNSLDSATLMNKGLEVIEACRFFDLRPTAVEVVVHRQSVAHAFVVFADGSVKAQLASPDMRMPIGYALAYPDRLDDETAIAATRRAIGLDGVAGTLTFEPVDHKRFPALRLAYDALERGGTYPAVLSAANEVAGRAFLQGKITFVDIAAVVAGALDAHRGSPPTLPDIEAADRWARAHARDTISKLSARTTAKAADG